MAAKKSGLGRGLDALFPEKTVQSKHQEIKKLNNITESQVSREKEGKNNGVMMVKISKVEPNREQPRKKV